jgi:hypothetical protein
MSSAANSEHVPVPSQHDHHRNAGPVRTLPELAAHGDAAKLPRSIVAKH